MRSSPTSARRRPRVSARTRRRVEPAWTGTGLCSGVVDAIGHPTGRQLGNRDPYDLRLDEVLAAAREHGVALEVNAMPDRLDLHDRHCRAARAAGVSLVVDSDAHNGRHLANLRFGTWMARRGWLEARDVLNTRPWEELAARREARRAGAASAGAPG